MEAICSHAITDVAPTLRQELRVFFITGYVEKAISNNFRPHYAHGFFKPVEESLAIEGEQQFRIAVRTGYRSHKSVDNFCAMPARLLATFS